MRPRRTSMSKGSELERSLAQELLGIGRAAERFMGEEEAEREVCSNGGGAQYSLPLRTCFMNVFGIRERLTFSSSVFRAFANPVEAEEEKRTD